MNRSSSTACSADVRLGGASGGTEAHQDEPGDRGGSYGYYIDKLEFWTTTNLLQFKTSKCKYMVGSRKRAGILPPPLTLKGQLLQQVDHFKYLGLLLSSDLSWSSHVENICNKARKLLGLLYRQYYQLAEPNTLLQLYLSLIRPHLEYASPVWNPYTCEKT